MSHFSDDNLNWSRSWPDREFMRLAAVTCAVTALIYFIELTSFTLSPDEALRGAWSIRGAGTWCMHAGDSH